MNVAVGEGGEAVGTAQAVAPLATRRKVRSLQTIRRIIRIFPIPFEVWDLGFGI